MQLYDKLAKAICSKKGAWILLLLFNLYLLCNWIPFTASDFLDVTLILLFFFFCIFSLKGNQMHLSFLHYFVIVGLSNMLDSKAG